MGAGHAKNLTPKETPLKKINLTLSKQKPKITLTDEATVNRQKQNENKTKNSRNPKAGFQNRPRQQGRKKAT